MGVPAARLDRVAEPSETDPSAALRFEDLSPRHRRRLLARLLTRAGLTAVGLVVLYYTAPLDRSFGAITVIILSGGLLALGVLIAVQVRQIQQAQFPRLQAINLLATSLPLFLLLFSTTYYLLARGGATSFSEPLTRTDSLYFTMTVFSTVGFGDITPVAQAARVIVMVQMMGDLLLFGLIGKVVLGAVSAGLQRRSGPGGAPSEATSGAAGDAAEGTDDVAPGRLTHGR